jgi:hypothetical protein
LGSKAESGISNHKSGSKASCKKFSYIETIMLEISWRYFLEIEGSAQRATAIPLLFI